MREENPGEGNDLESAMFEFARLADEGVTDLPDPLSSEKEAPEARADDPEPKDVPEVEADADLLEEQKETEELSDVADLLKEEQPENVKDKRKEKENERRDKSWQALEAAKEEFRREKEQLEQERQNIEEAKTQQRSNFEYRDDQGYTADDYEKASEEFREQGDAELAIKAIERANELRAQAYETEIAAKQESFSKAWRKNVDALVSQRADLSDGTTPLSKEVQKLLKEEFYFSTVPDGFERAVKYAEGILARESTTSLREQVKKLEAEVARLTKESSPGSSEAPSRPRKTKFDNLSSDDQFKALHRMVADADLGGEPLFG